MSSTINTKWLCGAPLTVRVTPLQWSTHGATRRQLNSWSRRPATHQNFFSSVMCAVFWLHPASRVDRWRPRSLLHLSALRCADDRPHWSLHSHTVSDNEDAHRHLPLGGALFIQPKSATVSLIDSNFFLPVLIYANFPVNMQRMLIGWTSCVAADRGRNSKYFPAKFGGAARPATVGGPTQRNVTDLFDLCWYKIEIFSTSALSPRVCVCVCVCLHLKNKISASPCWLDWFCPGMSAQ